MLLKNSVRAHIWDTSLSLHIFVSSMNNNFTIINHVSMFKGRDIVKSNLASTLCYLLLVLPNRTLHFKQSISPFEGAGIMLHIDWFWLHSDELLNVKSL